MPNSAATMFAAFPSVWAIREAKSNRLPTRSLDTSNLGSRRAKACACSSATRSPISLAFLSNREALASATAPFAIYPAALYARPANRLRDDRLTGPLRSFGRRVPNADYRAAALYRLFQNGCSDFIADFSALD